MKSWIDVAQSKRQSYVLKQSKRSDDGCFRGICWMDWDLMKDLKEIDSEEDAAAVEPGGGFLDIGHRVCIHNHAGVEGSIVTTRSDLSWSRCEVQKTSCWILGE